MKHSHLIILLFLGIIGMNFRCSPEPAIVGGFDHTFVAPVDIFPLKKTYSLNDTIWLQTDLPSKSLFDTKTNQFLVADTGNISPGGSYMEFGTHITNPAGGFCDVITPSGVNINRELSQWATGGSVDPFGCGQPGYTVKIGFKPRLQGIYGIMLPQDRFFGTCPGKMYAYYATISYQYKNVDLNQDVFNTLSKNDKGGKDGIKFYTDRINSRQLFVFKVE